MSQEPEQDAFLCKIVDLVMLIDKNLQARVDALEVQVGDLRTLVGVALGSTVSPEERSPQ